MLCYSCLQFVMFVCKVRRCPLSYCFPQCLTDGITQVDDYLDSRAREGAPHPSTELLQTAVRQTQRLLTRVWEWVVWLLGMGPSKSPQVRSERGFMAALFRTVLFSTSVPHCSVLFCPALFCGESPILASNPCPAQCVSL